jgi:hypothetical protein
VEWQFGPAEVRELIESDWKWWGNVTYDVDNALVNVEGSTAWVYIPATLASIWTRENMLTFMVKDLQAVVEDDQKSVRGKLLESLWQCCDDLDELEKGDPAIWRLRLTAVLVRNGDRWQFTAMHFSHPFCRFPYERICSETGAEESLEKLNSRMNNAARLADAEAATGVRAALEKLQEAYTRRDPEFAPGFVDEVFVNDASAFIVGTGDDEIFSGRDQAVELFDSDWRYWGNVKLNLDDALISSRGETAWFAVAGTVTSHIVAENLYSGHLDSVKQVLEEEALSPRQKIVEVARGISNTLKEGNRGDDYVWPFRLDGVLTRQDNGWRFRQLHFSLPTTWTPQVRV